MSWNFDKDHDEDQAGYTRIEPPRSANAKGAAPRSKRIRTKRRTNAVNGMQRRRKRRVQW
jgi:hypothetical protein